MDIDRTPSKTVEQRLARYGLQNREKHLADLHVMPDTTMHLTVDHPDHRQKMVVLPVKTAEQLKHWRGAKRRNRSS